MAITLMQNQTIVLAAGQTFALPWANFPDEHQNAQLVLAVKGLDPGGILNVQPQASWDTDGQVPIGPLLVLNAFGSTVVAISPAYGPLGPLFRLFFSAGSPSVLITLSAWLTPKSD